MHLPLSGSRRMWKRCLCGFPCDRRRPWNTGQFTQSQSSQEQDEASGQESSIPGSYTVPDGWVVASDHSTDEKIFYVEDGHEHDSRPDNISINVGKNRYVADDAADEMADSFVWDD